MKIDELPEIDFPDSDGEPMAETDVHRKVIVRVIDQMSHRYHGQQVYVTGDLLLYYDPTSIDKRLAPDVMVVKGCTQEDKRSYKLWKETVAPTVVFEITSRKTKDRDSGIKLRLYAELGVKEVILFDPLGEYLRPPLQGYRQSSDTGFEPMAPDKSGRLISEELGVSLAAGDRQLQIYDLATGEPVPTEAEAAAARASHEAVGRLLAEQDAETEAERAEAAEERARLAEEQARLAEEQARHEAEQRLAAERRSQELEAELARLRAQIQDAGA